MSGEPAARRPLSSDDLARNRWMTPLLLAPALVVSALLVIVQRSGGGGAFQLLVVAWVIWSLTAVVCRSRTMWQRDFLSGEGWYSRIARFLRHWYGLTGMATTILILLGWLVFAPITWLTRPLYIAIVLVAAGSLFIKGQVRKVAAGILVAAPAPAWIVLLLVAVVVLAIPGLVYLATIVVTNAISRRSTY